MSYPTEIVDCPRCDGNGETYDADLFMGDGFSRCTYCGGGGQLEVCANCLDDRDGCSVCISPTTITADSGGLQDSAVGVPSPEEKTCRVGISAEPSPSAPGLLWLGKEETSDAT